MSTVPSIAEIDRHAFQSALRSPVMAYLEAKALYEVLRKKVDEIKAKTLQQHQWVGVDGKVVTNPEYDFLLGDDDFRLYLSIIHPAVKEAIPHDLPEDYCPALVARNDMVEASHAVMAVGQDFLKFGRIYRQDLHDEMLDTLCGLALCKN